MIKNWLWFFCAAFLPVPWLLLQVIPGLFGASLSHEVIALLTGASIIGAAFFLSWAIELLEHDLPSSLSLIIIALVSVLPEYAVDLTFAWKAGQDQSFAPFAIANMTGANRLLIGLGWAVVVFFAWARTRKPQVEIEPAQRLESGMLFLATIYSFSIPIRGQLYWIDAIVLGALFLLYAILAARGERSEPELVGPAALLNKLLTPGWRRLVALLMLAYGGVAIWFAAEPFAHHLVEIGRTYGLDEFLLVQWIAPLASESPEFIVALLFVARMRAGTGLGALLSSKVNQWTLLVGAIPIAYMLSRGESTPFLLDERQRDELLLTSAQSFLAALFLSDLRLTVREALLLLFLFTVQLLLGLPVIAQPIHELTGLSVEGAHAWFSVTYGVLAILFLFNPRRARSFWLALTLRAQKS